jgi:polyisoprenoid-binding protein YceI
MNSRNWFAAFLTLGFASLLWSDTKTSGPQQHAIDTRKSVIAVRVSTAGLFKAFAHDHDIAAPIARGSVNTAAQQADLQVDAGALRVRDTKASEKDRAEIQKAMLGPKVLDSERYPEIVFKSTAVEPAGSGAWKVHGDLTLHGQTRPVDVDVSEKDGHYIGKAVLKQTDFGIRPVRIAGGTVRVKDEIRIEFDIQLTR